MNYYERHIGDYLKDTAHLSLLEHGIYGRLLDIYYSREAGLPADQIARLVGARSEEEKSALGCVLAEFFVLEDGGVYVQARCAAEIARFKAKQAQAQRAAQASVASRQASVERPLNARSAPVEPTLNVPSNQTPVTNKEKEKPARKRATPLPDGFGVSDRVGHWALGKGFVDLPAQFEAFVSYAKRKGATYVDWDEALMTAIREDWAKVRNKPADIARVTVPADPASFNRTREAPMTPEQKESADRARRLAMSAIKPVRVA